ncbi:MAG: hypothetical protein PQJ46_07605, partial [Spirochaetales bacterium]|nr:hypothetical protein [Spirochaetales bacterium]
ENEIMRELNIPGLDVQIEQHSHFLSYLHRQAELLKQNNFEKITELERELLFWWVQHINIYDTDTFMDKNWYSGMFRQAKRAEDIAWIINKTGNKDIDSEHNLFIKMIFEMKYLNNSETNAAAYKAEALNEISSIIDFATKHFNHEEELMSNAKMEIFEWHKKDHKKIIDGLNSYKKAIEDGVMDFSEQFRDLILQWWILHTNSLDYETFGADYEK